MKKHFQLFALFIFSITVFALACQKSNVAEKPLNFAEKQAHKSIGVVKSIDADAGKITVDSEAIPDYMPAMQMSAAVSDAKMLDTVKTGDKVEFEFEDADSKTVITKLSKIGETAQTGGGEIYKTNCAECHGGAGEGASKGISLLKGHALKHSETEYIEQVTKGEGKKMPAFKDKLSPEQITSVVKYVREELQKDVPKEETTEHKH
jgi:Cu/Ag efflux protein CusF